MGWQQAAVPTALGGEDVPVHCALSFAGEEWPLLFARPVRFGDVWVSWPGKLADLVAEPGRWTRMPLSASPGCSRRSCGRTRPDGVSSGERPAKS
jgi:hypothetical protein